MQHSTLEAIHGCLLGLLPHTHSKLHEVLEVCKEKFSEAVGPCEQLLDDEEGSEADLRMFPLQL